MYAYPIPNEMVMETAITVSETIPIKLMTWYSRLPYFGTQKLRDMAKLARNVSEKMYNMQGIFHHFINNSWIFETEQQNRLINHMTPEELRLFNFDLRTLDWNKAINGFSYGLRRFYIREDCLSPEMKFEQILAKNQIGPVHDIMVSKNSTRFLHAKDNITYFQSVISEQKYQDFIKDKIGEYMKTGLEGAHKDASAGSRKRTKKHRYFEQLNKSQIRFNKEQIENQLFEMRSRITLNGTRAMMWYFSKMMRNGI